MNGTNKVLIALACFGTLAIGGLAIAIDPATMAAADDAIPGIVPLEGPATAFSEEPVTSAAVLATDASGDARDHGVSYFNTGSQCRFGCARAPTIADAVPTSAPGAVPAPWMDIVEAGFLSETASNVQLVLRIHTLTKGFPELTPAPSTARGVDYIVCFGSEKGERCATLNVVPQTGGPVITSYFSIFSGFCGEALFNDAQSERPTVAPVQLGSECTFEVPARVDYGSPASIVFEVPKTYAEIDGPSTPWNHIRANVSHYWLQPGPIVHSSVSINPDALPHHHDHMGPAYPADFADELTPTSTDIRFNATTATLPSVDGSVANAPYGLAFGDTIAKDPLFDLLSTSIREEGTDVIVTQNYAAIQGAKLPDFEHMNVARVSNGPLFEFGAFHFGEDSYAYAGRCFHFHCVDSYLVKLPMTITEGSPAQIEYRVPREYFGNPGPGSVLTYLHTITQEVYPSYYTENGHENVHTMGFVDQHVGVLPYTFMGEAVDREAASHTHG